MLPIEGQPILTAAQMRAAEERAAPTPEAMYALMERAGAGVAEAVSDLAPGAKVLVLCGPGNNGGDGYVAARVLQEGGLDVRVAALADPATDNCRRAREAWCGPVERLSAVTPESAVDAVIVDALFGTGLARPLGGELARLLDDLFLVASLSIAIDLPSGVDVDSGAALSGARAVDVTLVLGTPKPAHLLMPAADGCGTLRLVDLGHAFGRAVVHPDRSPTDWVIKRPALRAPDSGDHKYTRGMTVVIGGAMPGAAALSVTAAMRAGAGYGLLLSDEPAHGLPHAVVQRRWSAEALHAACAGKDKVAIVVGPGLGRDDRARAKLTAAITAHRPLVIDGDALHLLDKNHLEALTQRENGRDTVLTPHAGEFAALFGPPEGSKIEATRTAACRAGATVVFKGADTVVAHSSGSVAVLHDASRWLSTAGTGDVLAGAIAGVWHAARHDPVAAGVWLHAEAARRCGASFIADDLAAALTPARASLCR